MEGTEFELFGERFADCQGLYTNMCVFLERVLSCISRYQLLLMNIPLLLFNIVFYGTVLYLYGQAKQDPSISLGIGFAYIFLFVLFPIVQVILWRTKIIKVRTTADKIGMVTATPLLPLIFFTVAARISQGNARSSTFEFNVNNHRYQEAYYNFTGTTKLRKIEFYKSNDTVSEGSPFPETDKWVKDSIWLYFSETGDTIRKEHYRNDTLLNYLVIRNDTD